MKHLPCTGLDPVNNPLRQVSLSSPFSAEDTRAKRGKDLAQGGFSNLGFLPAIVAADLFPS